MLKYAEIYINNQTMISVSKYLTYIYANNS